jgi:hypothetical protein
MVILYKEKAREVAEENEQRTSNETEGKSKTSAEMEREKRLKG